MTNDKKVLKDDETQRPPNIEDEISNVTVQDIMDVIFALNDSLTQEEKRSLNEKRKTRDRKRYR